MYIQNINSFWYYHFMTVLFVYVYVDLTAFITHISHAVNWNLDQGTDGSFTLPPHNWKTVSFFKFYKKKCITKV